MNRPRYIVYDDTSRGSNVGRNADQLAVVLRAPLAAIGVRVVRQHGARSNPSIAAFQAHGWPRRQYQDKLDEVDAIVIQYVPREPGAFVRNPSGAAEQGSGE
jgi:hypothetical protein